MVWFHFINMPNTEYSEGKINNIWKHRFTDIQKHILKSPVSICCSKKKSEYTNYLVECTRESWLILGHIFKRKYAALFLSLQLYTQMHTHAHNIYYIYIYYGSVNIPPFYPLIQYILIIVSPSPTSLRLFLLQPPKSTPFLLLG